MPFYHTIVCVDKKYGIARYRENDKSKTYIPWHFNDNYKNIKKQDLLFFKKLTTGHTIIMGRKTYEEIGILPNRENIVI
jgi:dihydrofolate reductase